MRAVAAVLLRVARADVEDFVCSGKLAETVPCGTAECTVVKDCTAVDGEWGEWAEWGHCDCSSSTRTRSRSVAVHASCDGTPVAGPLQQSESCEGGEDCAETAPVDCALSIWNPWTECKCHVTQVYRTRLLETWAEQCGTPCAGSLKETKECDQTEPEDCEEVEDCTYEEWEKWSDCSKSCGGGQQTRSRLIKHDAHNGGAGCDESLEEIAPCNEQCCTNDRVNCEYEEWGGWGACTATCGGGHRVRSREVEHYPRHGGAGCPHANLEEIEPCGIDPCEAVVTVNGEWKPWEEWTECSQTCGGGYTSRSRELKQQAAQGGLPAVGPYSEWAKCNEQGCAGDAVDCVLSDWEPWQGCSCACTGIQKSVRHIIKHGSGGGKVCEGGLQKVQPCNLPGSPGSKCTTSANAPCVWNPWSAWSECSAECLGGIQTRTRTFPGEAAHPDSHGVSMPTESTGVCEGPVQELRACNTFQCYMVGEPVDCLWEEWGAWSACSVSCGQGGEKARYRTIKIHPKFGGAACAAENSVEVASCDEAPCVATHFCTWSEWAPWNACSVSCGGGQRMREKHLEVKIGNAAGSLANSADQNLIELRKGVEELRMQRKTRTAGLAAATALGAVAVAFVARGRSSEQTFELIESAD
jgi:hypothetical protein